MRFLLLQRPAGKQQPQEEPQSPDASVAILRPFVSLDKRPQRVRRHLELRHALDFLLRIRPGRTDMPSSYSRLRIS